MINTLTLNPAIDRVMYLDVLEKNLTNRIEDVAEVIGGKGTHVSINLKLLGQNSRAFGICHGASGRRIIGYLENYGLEVAFIHKEGASSRTNYLIVERNNDCTIIAEKGVPLGEDDLAEIVAMLKERTGKEDSLVLSGDASNCSNPYVYNDILAELRDKGLRVFVDTSGPALARCAADAPFLIKPNLDELSTLCGREVSGDDQDLLRALDSLDKFDVKFVAVSLGKGGSIVKCPQGIYRAVPPPVHVRNTIGCGDCFLAGLVHGITEGMSIETTLGIATAASAATAESSLSVGFDEARAGGLIASCEIRKLA
ncbi:MAG: 1-phosphofructokinase family hexose kinase [Rectinemataceae bacterium]